uniref:Uncharacterized protein n=1 Tax=viral metagenome TaxID=1070528 RepID=A0A6C0I3Z1_9ZZZZ
MHFLVRNDAKKCGKEGALFEKNRFKMITVPYYYFLDFWIVIPMMTFASVPIGMVLTLLK